MGLGLVFSLFAWWFRVHCYFVRFGWFICKLCVFASFLCEVGLLDLRLGLRIYRLCLL